MLAILSFGKWLAVAFVVCGLLAGIYFKGKGDQRASDLIHERNAVAAVQRNLDTCHANGQALEASLAAQNSAVTALKAESDARVAASVKAVSGARAVAESYRQSAASILRVRPGVDRCASASELILEAVR